MMQENKETGLEREPMRWVTNQSFQRVVMIGLVLLLPLMLYQFFLISKDMILGDGSSGRLIIQPRYEILRIPENSIAIQYDAVGRLAADLAQVYFPARDHKHLENAYSFETTTDPWGRPSRYAPFVHFLCVITICQLPYGFAAF